MSEELMKALKMSAAGMRAQGTRLRVISENVANADSLPTEPGGNPYRRKIVTFRNELDQSIGLRTVKIDKIQPDPSEFVRRFEPNHPAADPQGYVRGPNVNMLIEMMDMRQAQRSYEANLAAMRTTRSMLQSTIDILRQ